MTELTVAIGLIIVLLAILFPTVARVRESARQTACASNLRQLGVAFSGYAAGNRGYIPRGGGYRGLRGPNWVAAIGHWLKRGGLTAWSDLPEISVLQCPAHPTADIPSAFVMNAFAFETRPAGKAAAASRVADVRNPSDVPLLLETPDLFGVAHQFFDDIFFEPEHVAFAPKHLPRAASQRISDTRHRARFANVLFFDGHVASVSKDELTLERFDDRPPGGRR